MLNVSPRIREYETLPGLDTAGHSGRGAAAHGRDRRHHTHCRTLWRRHPRRRPPQRRCRWSMSKPEQLVDLAEFVTHRRQAAVRGACRRVRRSIARKLPIGDDERFPYGLPAALLHTQAAPDDCLPAGQTATNRVVPSLAGVYKGADLARTRGLRPDGHPLHRPPRPAPHPDARRTGRITRCARTCPWAVKKCPLR